jgi:hypothetical protein
MDTPYTQGFKAGLAWERERIIKLLLEHQPEVGVDSGFVYCSCGISEIWYTEHSIELIKGETNGET